MKLFICALAAFLFTSLPVFAETYACMPESFTLTENADGYVLKGTLETPTPNYTYAIDEDSGGKYTLALTAPEGMSIQVIGSLAIGHTFKPEEVTDGLDIGIVKSFGWGIERISCRKKS